MSPKLLVSNAAVGILAVAGITYTSVGILHVNPLDDDLRITVELPATGGVFDQSEVTYRGDRVGSVVEVVPRPGGVQVEVSIDGDVRIPADTKVVVAGLSAVGEQTLDFRPQTSEGPFLQDGDVVPESATAIPVGFDVLLRNVTDLVAQLDTKDLHTVVDELYRALDGTGPDLRRLIGDSAVLLETLESVMPETRSLLRNGHEALTSIDSMSDDLESFGRSAKTLTSSFRNSEHLYLKLLEDAPGQIASVLTVMTEMAVPAYRLMDDGTAALGVLARRVPALNALLAWLPIGAESVSLAFHGGGLNGIGDFMPSNLCDYGTPMRTPWKAHDDPPDLTRSCTERAPDLQQRGSSNAPR